MAPGEGRALSPPHLHCAERGEPQQAAPRAKQDKNPATGSQSSTEAAWQRGANFPARAGGVPPVEVSAGVTDSTQQPPVSRAACKEHEWPSSPTAQHLPGHLLGPQEHLWAPTAGCEHTEKPHRAATAPAACSWSPPWGLRCCSQPEGSAPGRPTGLLWRARHRQELGK